MNRNHFILILVLAVILSSCGAYKKIPYYQDLSRDKPTEESIMNYSPLVVQPADILGISVSSRTPESSAIFNYSAKDMQSTVSGYVVDAKGDVQLPLVGILKVAGLTTTQVQEKMNQLLLTFYKDPVVNVRLLNFKVAVYGDVLKPNIYTLQDEKINIMQALTLAGDLNITAMRNVMLIREENGKRNFIPIDLTSKNLFQSSYYYLKNNDQLYVQPDKTKYSTVDRGYKTATLVLSGLSIIAIVLSNLFR